MGISNASGLSEINADTILTSIGAQSGNNLSSAIAANNALLLPKWRVALGKVRMGQAVINYNARILCIGDSTTYGRGATGLATSPVANSWPAHLAAKFNDSINPAMLALGVPPTNFNTNPDDRWTLGSGWAKYQYAAANNCSIHAASTPGGSAVFAPGVNCDGFYVYYISNTGVLGSLTCTGSGGTPVVIDEGAAALAIRRSALVSCASASSANTITFTGTGELYVVGVEPVISTQNSVLVGNAGVSGSKASDWNTSGSSIGALNFITAYSPDLSIISLGINDSVAGSVSASTFQTNMQAIVTRCLQTGDVILCDFPPSDASAGGGVGLQPSYIPVYQRLAVTNNCLYLSIWKRFGSTWNTNFMYDTLHPNDYGYWDWTQAMYELLTSF